jgi:hypothetical protein
MREEPLANAKPFDRLDSRSRMSGDAHVRFCESLGVKFPRATRLFVEINGETFYLWRAVDHEGEVLESFFTKRRNRRGVYQSDQIPSRSHLN